MSRCNCTPLYTGENAIAARSDLNPSDGKYSFDALGLRNHAATDTKVFDCIYCVNISQMSFFRVSSDMAPLLKSYAVSGPTHIQQPVFVWSESLLASTSHVGMPDRWDFDPEVEQSLRTEPVCLYADLRKLCMRTRQRWRRSFFLYSSASA